MTDKVSLKKRSSMKVFITCVMPLLIIAVFSSVTFSVISGNLITSKLKEESLSKVQNLCNEIMLTIQPDLHNIEVLSDVVKATDDQEFIKATADSLFENASDYADALYAATQKSRFDGGFYIESPDWEPEDDWEPCEDDWFIETTRNNGKITYIEPAFDEASNEINLSFSKAVMGENNRPYAVVAVDVTMSAFSDLVEIVEISKNGIVRIVDKNGLYLTSPDQEEVLNTNFFEENKFAEEIKPSDFLNEEKRSEIHDGKYYSTCRIGNTPWYVIAEGPVSDFTGSLVTIVIIIVCLLLVLCIFSAIFISRSMSKMHENERVLGGKLFSETQNLVVAAKENAATSQDQSASVKEIVATMEDTNALSENISTRIKDVNHVADKTSSDVKVGVDALTQNVSKLHEIFDANQKTIAGIKSLSDQIDSVWEIVTFINSVADQAKIIAFNAELEASSAGEAGKNFHIVSTEIRRLADGIIEGTKEIKEKITSIQQSSDSLILVSESGTEKINSGCEEAAALQENFLSIRNAAEITADSAKEITNIIQQQTIASEQILITLKQISAGVENFTTATENISSASENIKVIAEELNSEQTEKKA